MPTTSHSDEQVVKEPSDLWLIAKALIIFVGGAALLASLFTG